MTLYVANVHMWADGMEGVPFHPSLFVSRVFPGGSTGISGHLIMRGMMVKHLDKGIRNTERLGFRQQEIEVSDSLH